MTVNDYVEEYSPDLTNLRTLEEIEEDDLSDD